ncbi:FHA domain-containing protein FhaA [Corynebacterium ciconiae DSM 44920]|nr:FHA domain-containing protein FhaA [Corynebacterium ciconiae DSM 44920]
MPADTDELLRILAEDKKEGDTASAMSVWSRFAKMDSALQRGLDNSFAFVFGGKIVAAEVEEALKQCAEDEAVTTYEGYVEVPNQFEVMVGKKDFSNLQETSPELPWDFADRLTRYFRNQNWSPAGPVVVKLVQAKGLRTGQLKSTCVRAQRPEDESGFYGMPDDAADVEFDESIATHAPSSYEIHDPDEPAAHSPQDHTSSSTPRQHEPADHQPAETNGHMNSDHHNSHGAAASAGAAYGAATPTSAAHRSDLPKAAALPAEDSGEHASETTIFASHTETPSSNLPADSASPAAPAEPTVSLLLQDGSSRTFLVQNGSNIIGRSNDADFRLPDTGVSRQHAEVTWDGQDAVITDLQSTNGTTVNDVPVDNWLLADGDVITVGHSYIEVRITNN